MSCKRFIEGLGVIAKGKKKNESSCAKTLTCQSKRQ